MFIFRRRLGIFVVGAWVLFVVSLSGCSAVSVPAVSPAATSTSFVSPIWEEATNTSLRSLDVHRHITAAEAFPVALEAAMAWQRAARWYGVVPFTSIERAFAIPLNDQSPGWFFRFGVPDEGVEYIVEVLDGEVVGTNETVLPMYIEPPLDDLEPLGEEWNIIDNVMALAVCVNERCPLAEFPNMVIDYRLAKIKGQVHPVWTLYNAHDLSSPIFAVDAITGKSISLKGQ